MRVAVVDIGTNSTRLLVADVTPDGALAELHRESIVTRLGEGVDATGRLGEAPMERVFAALTRYRAAIDEHAATRTTAVLTSAVRDAANGDAFTRVVRERFDLDARAIGGDEEAALTYAGATSERPHDGSELVVVVDIGGGSTEYVAGRDGAVTFHTSLQLGVVRQTERHLHDDPPAPDQLAALADEAATIIRTEIPPATRDAVRAGIAVAGTATSSAAIDLALDPYDPAKVHGYTLELSTCELLLARLATMDDGERREVVGLHPDRAPTIVAGVAMLIESMRAFGLDAVEVSEHDILRGAALRLAALP